MLNYILVYQTETDGEIEVDAFGTPEETIARVNNLGLTSYDYAVIAGRVIRRAAPGHASPGKSIEEIMEDVYPSFSLPADSGPLDDPGEYCCDFLKYQLTGTCRGVERHSSGTEQCTDQMICYNGKIREYVISPVGHISYTISHCPGCGSKFPKSLREEWFDIIEKLGLNAWEDRDKIPKKYQTESWWKDANPNCKFVKADAFACDLKHLPVNQLCKPCQQFLDDYNKPQPNPKTKTQS